MNIINAQHIHKTFDNTKALTDVSVSVNKGELFGIIGPDGAGKTTLFRIIASLMLPDKGTVEVKGMDTHKDYKKIRKIIGYMPGTFSLYHDLSVVENLHFFARVYGTSIEENHHLVKDVYQQIEPFKHRRAGNLSGGMKQKLALSCTLIHQPEIMILDEPTTGVDPVSRQEFWKILKGLRQFDMTIVVSTPYMDEASLCDRIALIQNGEILTINTPAQIAGEFGKPLYAIKAQNIYNVLKDLRTFEGTQTAFSSGQEVHLTLKDGYTIDTATQYLTQKQHADVMINKITPGIEDCFLDKMMNKNNLK